MACSASGVRVRVRVRVYVYFQWAGPVWVLVLHLCACRRLAWAREDDSSWPYRYYNDLHQEGLHIPGHTAAAVSQIDCRNWLRVARRSVMVSFWPSAVCRRRLCFEGR